MLSAKKIMYALAILSTVTLAALFPKYAMPTLLVSLFAIPVGMFVIAILVSFLRFVGLMEPRVVAITVTSDEEDEDEEWDKNHLSPSRSWNPVNIYYDLDNK